MFSRKKIEFLRIFQPIRLFKITGKKLTNKQDSLFEKKVKIQNS